MYEEKVRAAQKYANENLTNVKEIKIEYNSLTIYFGSGEFIQMYADCSEIQFGIDTGIRKVAKDV